MGSEDSSDSQKWQQHLALLREQYVNLYNNYTELQQKYSIATASNEDQQSFIGKLLTQVASLYKEERYSDVTILLGEKSIPGHKFVFAARSDLWNSLKKDAVLDWKSLDETVASILLKWIYTDAVSQDQLTLELMRAAAGFGLTELVDKCERYLIGNAKLQDCVRLYTAAEELGTKKLRDHCSSLISCHWDDLDANDFKEMPGSLLYQLLKAKSDYPLHSAVRLQREDVVFLYLVEHNAELEEAVNRPDSKGERALEVALATRQPNLARSLVEHRADLRAKDERGLSLLHSAIRRADAYAAEFIVEQLQQRQPSRPVDEVEPESERTALHLLAEAAPATADMLRLAASLLRAGLDPNARDRAGWSPLHRCVKQRDEQLLELLLREMPRLDLEARTAEAGDTALGLALQAEPFFEAGAARLLAAGAQPNPRYPEPAADCLLHRLARSGLEQPALFLLAERTKQRHDENEQDKEEEDLGARDREGHTALHEAARAGLARLCARLVRLRPQLLTEPAGPDGDTAVHLAARHSRLEALRALLDAGSSMPERLATVLAARNLRGETALGLALQAPDCSPLLQALVEAGASLELRDERGCTALHQAILKEDVPAALLLLERGADVNARVEPSSSHRGGSEEQDGKTALQLAVHCRLGEVAEALLRRGASASLGCPLWDALESEQLEVASCLVAHGADPDCWAAAPELPNCQQSLLHRAIDENREDVGQFLVRSGCDLNSPRRPLAATTTTTSEVAPEARDECTPLHLCCQWGLEQLVQTLIEHGANVNARDAEGKTPLHVAIENQHERITALLLCHPNINLALRDKRAQSPFAAALARRNTRAAQAILARLPSAAEQLDAKGRNFLHTAIQRDDVESILFLLSVQVDVNSRVQDSAQTTPLQLAAAAGNEMLVRSLLLAGARVHEQDAHRDGPLHHAARHGHAAVVSALLQNGADFDAVNADGDNALHVAAREGHLGVARALLTECTLDAEAVNLKGRNPLHELARHGRDNAAAICELFFECMPKYPLNNADLDGNTPLLQAYMKGNGNLCRSLVKAGACLGSMNKDGVTIFNYQVATKQLLYRLLESLQQEAPWADKDLCLECGTKFSLTMRKHHCRHCGRILCSKCSGQDVPILKFGQNKPVRVCAVCFDVLQIGADC